MLTLFVRRLPVRLQKRLDTLPGWILANPGSTAGWVVAVTAVIAAIAVVVTTLHGVTRSYTALPYQDEWELVGLMTWLGKHGFHWNIFMWQHNEHRLAIPRLLFLTDMYVFGFHGVFNLVSIQIIQALHTWVLWRLIVSTPRQMTPGTTLGEISWPVWARVLIGALIVSAMFSAYHLENLAWGFQSQFVGVFTLATASAWALSASLAAKDCGIGRKTGGTVHSWGLFAIACLLGAACNYTLAAGLMVWPMLLVIGVLMRMPWSRYPVLLGVAGICIWRYLVDFHTNPGHANPVESILNHPVQLLKFAAALLSSPLTDNDVDGSIVLAGLAMLVGIGVFLRGLVGGRQSFTVSQWTLFGLMMFIVAFALGTAAGRLNFGIEQSFSSRYKTPAIAFWIATLGLAVSIAWTNRVALAGWGRHFGLSYWPVAALGVAAAVSIIAEQPNDRDNFRFKALVDKVATPSLLLRVRDDPIYLRLYPSTEKLFVRSRELRQRELSIFANEEASWINRPLSEVVPNINGSECRGNFDGFLVPTHPLFSGADWPRLHGWAWDDLGEQVPRLVVAVDPKGVVVGFAYPGWPRNDVAQALGHHRYTETGWWGAAEVPPGTPIHTFAILSDGSACPLMSSHAKPTH